MRVTGGIYRSRPLKAPKGDATRPTSDRVRESLFAILESDRPLAGASALDLYSGTGALAFEALSRGASSATLVESERAALAVIRENAAVLGVTRQIHVIPRTVEQAIATSAPHSPFDLVLLDPPYAQVRAGATETVLTHLSRGPLVKSDGRIVLEHSKADPPPVVPGLFLVESRRYGDTVLSFYQKSGNRDEDAAAPT